MNVKLNFILIFVHLLLGAQFISAQDLDSLFSVGEHARLLKHFEANPPQSFKAKILKAKSLKAKNFTEDAIATYQEALADRADEPIHQFTFAKLLISNHQVKEADSLLTLLSANYPTNPEFLYQQGLTKAKLGQQSEDIYFEKALEQDSTHQAAAYALAKFYLKIKSYQKAETTSLKALKFNAKNRKMIGLLGQIYYRQRKLELALEQFEALEKLTPLPKFVIEKMAIAYANTNRLSLSVDKYKRLLKLDPRSFMYHIQLAQVYTRLKNFEDAEYHAQMAIDYKDTSLSNERYTKAFALKENGKLKEAIKEFELVIDEAQMFERAYVELALTADQHYDNIDKKLMYFDKYENQFSDYEYAEFKPLISRRLTDLRRQKHFEVEN